jgi:hypothetical protein
MLPLAHHPLTEACYHWCGSTCAHTCAPAVDIFSPPAVTFSLLVYKIYLQKKISLEILDIIFYSGLIFLLYSLYSRYTCKTNKLMWKEYIVFINRRSFNEIGQFFGFQWER